MGRRTSRSYERLQGSARANLVKRKIPPLGRPPCAVCGHKKSIGRRYGAVVCAACCSFFYRSSSAASQHFLCDGGNQNCVIKPDNRRCRYCRWNKCLAQGMSRVGVAKASRMAQHVGMKK